MRMPFRTDTLLLAAVIAVGIFACQRSETSSPAQKSSSQAPASAAAQKPGPPTQSGVYGFSGAKVAGGEAREGVIGECIWIYDERNQSQVAKGDCYKNDPGTFRVPLKPGHYVVRGPGGNTSINVKNGDWVKLESIVTLPLAP